jgi:DNA repair protein RecN (Recombination protein N)
VSLKRIVLRDFVIVDELDLELAQGFTVLTGETGAGKSILVDALQLATGGRADVNLIREGASRTEVCIEFDVTPPIELWLAEQGYDQEPALLLRRTLDRHGKSRAWINASPATVTQLRVLGEQLLDIHGQHAWQSLTRADAVRDLLDAYAQTSAKPTGDAWKRWRESAHALAKATAAQSTLLTERERLNWQIGELEKLDPGLDEWSQLNIEHTRLAHAHTLQEAAHQTLQTLDDDDNNARLQIGRALEILQKQEHIEPIFKGLDDVLLSSLAQLDDVVHSLHAYLRKADLDPQRLGELDQRLGLWVSLARRYKRSPQELPELIEQWRQELAKLDAATDLQALEQTRAAAWQHYETQAALLTRARRKSAPKLAQTITQAMQGLGMQGGQFEVNVQTGSEPMQSGMEIVTFLVAGHVGSTPRLISKVASGGELSRLALAIAVTTSQLGSAQTLIFDEVDAGIGGAVAETVGRLMQQLGADRQVLAVTHLPQVAAYADNHLVISKQVQGERTVSQIRSADGEQRVQELARMLGGERLLDSSLAHARDLLHMQDI